MKKGVTKSPMKKKRGQPRCSGEERKRGEPVIFASQHQVQQAISVLDKKKYIARLQPWERLKGGGGKKVAFQIAGKWSQLKGAPTATSAPAREKNIRERKKNGWGGEGLSQRE